MNRALSFSLFFTQCAASVSVLPTNTKMQSLSRTKCFIIQFGGAILDVLSLCLWGWEECLGRAETLPRNTATQLGKSLSFSVMVTALMAFSAAALLPFFLPCYCILFFEHPWVILCESRGSCSREIRKKLLIPIPVTSDHWQYFVGLCEFKIQP